MQFFKHYSKASESESLARLIDETGIIGYGRYWLLLEYLTDLFDGESTSFRIHSRIIRELFRIRSWTELDSFADRLATVRGMVLKRNGTVFEIEAPILLELQSRDFKKARTERANTAPKIKNKNKIKNKIKEEEVALGTLAAQSDKTLNASIWESYLSAYRLRYKVDPVRNAKVNGIVSQLGKRLGAEAVAVVAFFVTSNQTYYLQRTHAIDCCLKDAESLHVQWQKGKAITRADVHEFEKKAVMAETLQAIKDGTI